MNRGRQVSQTSQHCRANPTSDEPSLNSHSIALTLVDPVASAMGGYSACILPSMLEVVEGIVEVRSGAGGVGIRGAVTKDEGENFRTS
jgi:hypothetical protein